MVVVKSFEELFASSTLLPSISFSEYSTQLISSQIFFKDCGSGLFSIKSTCAGDGIVAAAAGGGNGGGSVADAADLGDGSVSAAVSSDGIIAAA